MREEEKTLFRARGLSTTETGNPPILLKV